MQLIQTGSIKEATSEYFFVVLEAAMTPLTTCNEPSLRADYHALFSAAEGVAEVSIRVFSDLIPYIYLHLLLKITMLINLNLHHAVP